MELKNVNLSQLKVTTKLRTASDLELEELASSIKSRGIICPLTVSKTGGTTYSVIDGRRRFAALRLIGTSPDERIPVLVVDEDKGADLERALITNAVRSTLDTWDVAEHVSLLANKYNRQSWELAEALGKTQRYINLLLTLFSLPKPILEALRARRITSAHGLVLINLNDRPELRDQVFEQLLERNLSVRDLEVLIGSMINREKGKDKIAPIFEPIIYDTNAGSRVRLEPRCCSIRIEINLKTIEDLEEIVPELKERISSLATLREGQNGAELLKPAEAMAIQLEGML